MSTRPSFVLPTWWNNVQPTESVTVRISNAQDYNGRTLKLMLYRGFPDLGTILDALPATNPNKIGGDVSWTLSVDASNTASITVPLSSYGATNSILPYFFKLKYDGCCDALDLICKLGKNPPPDCFSTTLTSDLNSPQFLIPYV
jgi:hypothetical protein